MLSNCVSRILHDSITSSREEVVHIQFLGSFCSYLLVFLDWMDMHGLILRRSFVIILHMHEFGMPIYISLWEC
jgi:hypothetical protein